MDIETTIPKELRFRVSPRTMQMLGRENISSPVIGVLELVKNAYDADATNVTITFRHASTNEGEITIADDGDGMTLNYEKLYNDLSMLVSPFDDTFDGFVIHLDCDEAPDYSGRVTSSVASAFEFKLEASLDKDGRMEWTLTHRSGETIKENKQWD